MNTRNAVVLLMFLGSQLGWAAPVSWQDVHNVSGDSDVATNGVVVKAYSFVTGNTPTVNGVAFRNFAAQVLDTQSFGAGDAAFYNNPPLSA